jgi:signal transduction histidine kinase
MIDRLARQNGCATVSTVAVMVLTVFLSLLALPTMADEGLLARIEMARDPGGQMDVNAAQGLEYKPAGHSIAVGYTGAAIWMRLHILPDPKGDAVVLMVRPPTLDYISLYSPDPDRPGGWKMQSIGGKNPIREEEWISSIRGFVVQPAEGGTTYFLRMVTTGSFAAHFVARPHYDAHRVGLLIDLSQLLYLSLMAVLLVWSQRMAIVTKDRLFQYFALLQALWIVHNAFYFGYVTLFLPQLPSDLIFVVYRGMVFVVSAMSVVFHKMVLRRFAPHRMALLFLDVLIAVMGSGFLIYCLGWHSAGLSINSLAVAATPVAFALNAVTARQSASPGLVTMRVIYLMLSLALMTWVFTLIGLYNTGTFALYGTMIHGTATGVLMFAILHLHGRNVMADAERAQRSLAALEERRAAEAEQTAMLVRFIDMLTHETKNALAVINMSVSAPKFGPRQQARVAEAARDLTSIIDRCNQSLRLDSQELTTTLVPCDPGVILREAAAASPAAPRIQLATAPMLEVRSDPVLLRVILTNLIENAVKYSAPQSEIEAGLSLGEGRAEIWVENQPGAAGLPDPAQVFQKYYRNPRALGQIGSGLGLYVVQGLARLLGGGIAYEPHEGRVRFRVWVPC